MKEIFTKRKDGKRCVTSIYYNQSWKEWSATFTEEEFKAFLKSHGIKFTMKDFNERILHMKHANKRETRCGIKYDNTILHKFIDQLVGHWRRVTCKNCLKRRLSEQRSKK